MKEFLRNFMGQSKPPEKAPAQMPDGPSDDSNNRLAHELQQVKQRIRAVENKLIFTARTREEANKGTQLLLTQKYRELAKTGERLTFEEVGFSNYSQFEEDGIILYIFSTIGAQSKRSVEICAGNGFESNSTNLILNHSWGSLLVDGNADKVEQGIDFFANHPSTRFAGPKFLCRWIDRETINDMLQNAGFSGDIDLLVLDLDGVDYWIWDAITEVTPRVVCVEVMAHLGEKSITVPYARDFKSRWIPMEDEQTLAGDDDSRKSPLYHKAQYGGASLPAFTKLAKSKGYRLVGGTLMGSNVFFMRNDVGTEHFPELNWSDCINTSFDVDLRAKMNEALEGEEWVTV